MLPVFSVDFDIAFRTRCQPLGNWRQYHRIPEWISAQGIDVQDIIDCIRYITQGRSTSLYRPLIISGQETKVKVQKDGRLHGSGIDCPYARCDAVGYGFSYSILFIPYQPFSARSVIKYV